MEYSDIAIALIGLFIAGIIKGTSGLGYSSCALPFLVAVFGLKMAIVIVVIPAMASNIAVMWSTGYLRETISRFYVFYISTIPGILLGIYSLIFMNQRYSEIILGVLIFIYSVYSMMRPPYYLSERLQKALQYPAGFLNGFFTGLTGSQVLPLLPYMLSLRLTPDRFVQAINTSVTLTAAVMVVALLASGLMSLINLFISILCVVPALAGIAIGNRIRRVIPMSHFRIIILIILCFIGILLILGL